MPLDPLTHTLLHCEAFQAVLTAQCRVQRLADTRMDNETDLKESLRQLQKAKDEVIEKTKQLSIYLQEQWSLDAHKHAQPDQDI